MFTALTGELLGVQKILPEREDVLQIQLKLPQISDKEGRLIPEQEIIRGISGAPILIEENGVDYCIGVFANLANDIQGSMQYGVPVNVLRWSNLFVHKAKCDVIKVPNKQNILGDIGLVELVIGDMDEFEFSDESMELNAWNKISDMFYKGYSVDELLEYG